MNKNIYINTFIFLVNICVQSYDMALNHQLYIITFYLFVNIKIYLFNFIEYSDRKYAALQVHALLIFPTMFRRLHFYQTKAIVIRIAKISLVLKTIRNR